MNTLRRFQDWLRRLPSLVLVFRRASAVEVDDDPFEEQAEFGV